MMKKKSLAVAMAAVTVAMPASQVFAAVVESDNSEQVKAMKEKALELLNKKFTDNESLLINKKVAGEKVFKVEIEAKDKTTTYTSYSEFSRDFDTLYNALEDGETIKINYKYAQAVDPAADPIVSIGYSTLADGTIVDFDTDTYTQGDLDKLAEGNNASNSEVTTLKVGDVQYKENEDDKTRTYQVRLSDGKDNEKRFADLKVGDIKVDVEKDNNAKKPVLRQENGYYVDLDGNAILEANDDDAITLTTNAADAYTIGITIAGADAAANTAAGEKLTKKAVIDGFYTKFDAADKAETPVIVSDVIKKGSVSTSFNSSELFNSAEGRLTTEGNDLLNRLQELTYNLNGVTYNVKVTEPAATKEIKIVVEKKSKIDSNFKKVEEIKIAKDSNDRKGESYKALTELLLSKTFDTTKKEDGTATYNEVANYSNQVATAAGADRYATAAEVSRKQFSSLAGDEKSVVLVTGEQSKLVDGLTATPLAAALNDGKGAPVLLTGNTKLAQPVIDEINRLKVDKVYIVGGAISPEVEKELKTKHGVKVERVAGADRYETSLEVADEIYSQTDAEFKNVFIAGGKSEADALSAGAAAARKDKVAPILLTTEDKLTKDVKYFLEGNKVADASKVYVVGGTVSKAAYNDIVDAHKDDVKRLSGDNRQDTNAEVINEFFTETAGDNTKATKVVVAKSDNKGMVDALGAGLYAGLNNAPVVLATNSLTEDQKDALDKLAIAKENDTDRTVNRLAVGNGIASSVIKYVKDLVK